ncbi:hypothetical protein PSHT_14373 [Puccinia striiformis]|uniref:CYRIA/CYRIB Rac1 binding domain-containing protein n=1 Tax=Puccinia striiformis TaxID=27350 RepID=A0A2S4UKE9_9BASI|nr:hypothetical protein PSHT_14373 [Puccinia striiformis]
MLTFFKSAILCMALHQVGAAILSSLDSEAHGGQSAKLGGWFHTPERERNIGYESKSIKHHINLLDPKGDKEFSLIKSQLGSLHDALKEPLGWYDNNINIWYSLLKQLDDFKTAQRINPDATKAKFQLDFLKCLFTLGDHIVRYKLIHPELIESSQFLESKTLLAMVEFHIDLLFLKNGERFFDAPDSVIPQLEFMKTSLTFKHFRQSISALSDEDQTQVVYVSLRTILSHIPGILSQRQLSPIFTEISQLFRRPESLQEMDGLSSSLRKESEIFHVLDRKENLPTVSLIIELISYFRFPRAAYAHRKIEFQLVYYILEFLEDHYQPVMDAILQQRPNDLDLRKQLEFINGLLKFFRNRDQYPISTYENPDISFWTMTKGGSALSTWIDSYILGESHHVTIFKDLVTAAPNQKFTIWMTKINT